MSYANHRSSNSTYYLICDPVTGEIIKRTRKWELKTSLLGFQLKVSKAVWKNHKVGDQLDTTDIHEPELARWLAMRALVARKDKLTRDERHALVLRAAGVGSG